MPNVRQSARQKFSFVEHLTEAFSVGCGSVCSQENIDPSVKAACDLGSQRYCSSYNIASPDCLTYADRLARTRAAQRTNAVYSNSVLIPTSSSQTITSYYTSLGNSAKAYVLNNINNLSSDNVVSLMKIFQTEEPSERQVYTKVSDAVIAELSKTDRPKNFGLTIGWLKAYVDEVIDLIANELATFKTAEIIRVNNNFKPFINMFMDSYSKVFDVLVSKLTIEDIANPALYEIDSPYLMGLIRSFIIQYITGKSPQAGETIIDLSKSARLYNKYVLDAYNWFIKNRSTEPLIAMIQAAKAANMKYYITVDDVNNDPVCVAMILAGEPIPYEARCSLASNIIKPECIAFVEKKINAPGASIDDIYLSIIQSATDGNGNISKVVLDTYPSIKQWLATKMADESVVVDGVPKITPVCGTAGNLSISQCNQLCKMYPELCIPDQIQKCSLPNYRFAKEGLLNKPVDKEGMCTNPADKEETEWWWIIAFALVVIAIAIAWTNRKYNQRKRTRLVLPFTIEPVRLSKH